MPAAPSCYAETGLQDAPKRWGVQSRQTMPTMNTETVDGTRRNGEVLVCFVVTLQSKGLPKMRDDTNLHHQYIRPSEAATITGLSVRTITGLCQKGQLPAVKVGKSWPIDRQKFADVLSVDNDFQG